MFSPCLASGQSSSYLVSRRKAWDLNPYPREEARISSAARRTVSGYLPFVCQWTHPESNWDCRHARAVSFRWTMSPCCSVDRMGIEPITPILQGSVASLGTCQPVCQRSVRESNPVSVLTTDVCYRNTYRP